MKRLWAAMRGANPLVWDGLLAAATLAAALTGLTAETTPDYPREADLLAVVLTVACFGSLALRRRHPIAVLAVTVTTAVVFLLRQYPENGHAVAVLISLYTLASLTPRRTWMTAAGAVAATVLLLALVRNEDLAFGDAVGNLAVFGIGAAFGDANRNRRDNTRALELRAEALEQNQAIQAEQAVAEERLRIARQLHDVVAHALAVIAVQSGVGGHVIESDPDEAKRVLDNINQASRETLDEMRRMLGVLRGEDGAKLDLAPAPGLGDIDQLVRGVRDAGLEVTVERTGDLDAVPAGAALTAFRIVQEALTNALKHAGPARAEVHLAAEPGVVRIEVCDDGRGASVVTDDSVLHLGLIGMRERVIPYGGELEVGPRPGGGWRVCATLPYERVDA